MRRQLMGLALVAHGLAHATAGNAAVAAGSSWLIAESPGGDMALRWLAAALWAIAMAGFVAAGLGAAGVPGLRRAWRGAAIAAALASLPLLLGFGISALSAPGVLIDLLVLGSLARERPSEPRDVAQRADAPLRRARPRLLVTTLAFAAVAWLGLLAGASPGYRFWGSMPGELAMDLPGDVPLTRPPSYWIQHAVTIRAPAPEVWPWLAQLGTDRGGFYSVSWLENLVGLPVHNADRVHPEWQDVRTGGFVMATPPGWLGLDRPLGWKLLHVEAGRVLVLENWGAFVLVPADSATTRFIVRTRGDRSPTPVSFALAWLGLATFEPAHFIMERAMMLGIRRRAEAAPHEP